MLLSRAGESLVELLVALLVVAAAATTFATTAVVVARLGARADRESATSLARWQAYREAEAAPACADSAIGRAVPLEFAATANLPALATLVRCGR